MFIYFISIIITTLTLSIFSSIFSLKTNFMHIDLSQNEMLVVKEKIIKEAADSYCRNNFTECLIENESIDLNQTIISNYYPDDFTPIDDLNITLSKTNLTIFQNVDENYSKLKDNQNIICLNTECTNISKVFNNSEELKIKYLLYDIIKLEDEIQLINNEIQLIDDEIAILLLGDPVDQIRIDELNAQKLIKEEEIISLQGKITILEGEIVILNQVILNRKVGGF